MVKITPYLSFSEILGREKPQAVAWLQGNQSHSQLGGFVKFYATSYGGVLVEAEVYGLPDTEAFSNFYAFHIHEYGDCSNNFSHAGGHYNPYHVMHPQHAGDMPPLISNQGYAWSTFYDSRFGITELIGKSVIIHAKPDDFVTQPSGNSGEMIGCGVIRFVK